MTGVWSIGGFRECASVSKAVVPELDQQRVHAMKQACRPGAGHVYGHHRIRRMCPWTDDVRAGPARRVTLPYQLT